MGAAKSQPETLLAGSRCHCQGPQQQPKHHTDVTLALVIVSELQPKVERHCHLITFTALPAHNMWSSRACAWSLTSRP